MPRVEQVIAQMCTYRRVQYYIYACFKRYSYLLVDTDRSVEGGFICSRHDTYMRNGVSQRLDRVFAQEVVVGAQIGLCIGWLALRRHGG